MAVSHWVTSKEEWDGVFSFRIGQHATQRKFYDGRYISGRANFTNRSSTNVSETYVEVAKSAFWTMWNGFSFAEKYFLL